VRQSSVTAALQISQDLDKMLGIAEKIEAWVFRRLAKLPEEVTPLDVEAAMREIMAMKDDIPA